MSVKINTSGADILWLWHRKRVSSQIEDLQSKSEKKKMEVSETVLNAFKSAPYIRTAQRVHVH